MRVPELAAGTVHVFSRFRSANVPSASVYRAMPELPDVVVYLERLEALIGGQPLDAIRLRSPFLVRSYDPPIQELEGKRVLGFSRIGKRLVFEFEADLFLVLHLMIAGRLKWRELGHELKGKLNLAAFDFPNGTLLLTEAGSKKRASVHVVRGRAALDELDRGGLEPLQVRLKDFAERLCSENRTLKRALTDPRLFSGIGNAYSDEILHHARLSPIKLTSKLEPAEVRQLHLSCRKVLTTWLERLRTECADGFPEKVTAFREQMAVHGRYRQACPTCGTLVQRIAYASNECNYCPTCQTEGRLLADRGLSRLLKKDWPKSLEELEERLEKWSASSSKHAVSRTVRQRPGRSKTVDVLASLPSKSKARSRS